MSCTASIKIPSISIKILSGDKAKLPVKAIRSGLNWQSTSKMSPRSKPGRLILTDLKEIAPRLSNLLRWKILSAKNW